MIVRSRFEQDDDDIGDASVEYRGMVNEGMTCYINSLL